MIEDDRQPLFTQTTIDLGTIARAVDKTSSSYGFEESDAWKMTRALQVDFGAITNDNVEQVSVGIGVQTRTYHLYFLLLNQLI